MVSSRREPIAIVGIGCRLPGGVTTVEAFWETIRDGINKVSDIPVDRFNASLLYDNGDSRTYGSIRNCKGGFVDDISAFDAEFFGYYPAEASRIDPQQRLALEASVHALEDSGTPLDQIAGSRTGVFFGNFLSDYMSVQTTTEHRDELTPHVAMGVANCSIANRVSHKLDLQGPSLTLDTACSSSLVSVHLACQSIWANESDAALAGGVNAILRPESNVLMSKAGFLSPDGACKSFDAAANGYVRSEGVGVVFLKPLSRALCDGDRIYALVRGSLVNQDGNTPEGFTVPSLKAQSALLRSLYIRSGVDPTKVWYVEAHGPGTAVGDPIEANALGRELGQVRSHEDDPLRIGSLKGNFGHLEGAAGIAGFIKAALVAFKRTIPPQANHKNPNPAINFHSLKLTVPLELTKVSRARKIWVGVNSFGAGGTNAHAVLEEAPKMATSSPAAEQKARIFLLAARSLPAMEDAAKELVSYLRHKRPALDDVAYTLNVRRSRHTYVSAVPAQSFDDLCSRLEIVASKGTSKDILTLHKRSDTSRKVAFVFSGQGGQWLGMGAALAEQEPVFRESLTAFDAIFTSRAGFSILPELSAIGDLSRLNQTKIVQPAIAAIQIGLAKTLMSYGITPHAVVGHSIGEAAASYIAGALSLEQAVEVIYFRSTIQDKASGTGTMLATGMTSKEAEQMIDRRKASGHVEIAALNGLRMTVLSGNVDELRMVADELTDRGTFARFVNVDVPYHSRFMDCLEAELVAALSEIKGKSTNIVLYSTVTTNVEPGTHLNGQYWFDNVRKPVRYVETAKRMLKDGYDFLIEIGPHPVLVSGTVEIAESLKLTAQVLPSMVKRNDIEPLSRVIGAACAFGIDADIHSFNGGGGRFEDLPLYPFQRQDYWFEHPEAQQNRLASPRHPFLKGSENLLDDGRAILRLRLSAGVSPYLQEHEVQGATIFPMTGHLEAAYLAAKEHMPYETNVWLENLSFEHPLILTSAEEFAPKVLLEITTLSKDFVIASCPTTTARENAWQVCSRGRINAVDQPPIVPSEPMHSVKARIEAGMKVNVDKFYKKIEKSGLRYGKAFRAVRKIWRVGNEIFSYVQLPPQYHREALRYRFHPALLDACNHTFFADIHHHGDPRLVYLPYKVDRVQIFDANGVTSAFSHAKITSRDNEFICCNVSIYDESGQILALVVGLTLKRLEGQPLGTSREYEICFEPEASQQGFKRANVEFSDIFVLDLQLSDFDWKSLTCRAFPNALIHEEHLDHTTPEWDSAKWGFELHRRTLVLVPAMFSPLRSHDSGIHDNVDVVFRALMRIAGWVHKSNGTCTIIVLTQGGCMTPSDSQCHPVSSSLAAAVRVMGNESPRARIRVVDLGFDETSQDTALLEEELGTIRPGRDDMVVAIRSGNRFFETLVVVDREGEEKRTKTLLARGGEYRCEKNPAGASLDSTIMRQQTSREPGGNDVAIEVHAAGLNFKDVMNGMGLLSEKATAGGLAGQELGLEVAGRVIKVGKNVRDLEIGAHVMASVSNGLAGIAVVDYRLVAPAPSLLSMAEAACVPIAYVSAYYSLVYLGRMTRGDSVLVHSAAGGVGRAAIQIAQLFGARVFATAGSPARRAKALEWGAEAVFDTRSLSFHDEVKKATGGRGVDLVLNSLIGPMFAQSIACLAPFGRFLEIGKTDIYRNMRVGLESFGDNCSFFAVDVDRLALQRPDLFQRMLSHVYSLFENGQLLPPPVTKFPITQLPAALSALSRSAVVGKVAVEMPSNTSIEAILPDKLRLQNDKSYLITGGAGGLGIQIARFLVQRGARHLVLVSRSGLRTAEDQAIVADMREQGVTVHMELIDVGITAAVSSLFEQKTDRAPIAGVIHCAAVSQSAFAHEVTLDSFWNVFQPKAIGAWNLHMATREKKLDFFIMTSSASSITGSAGLFSYSAANQFLDSLAHYRRASGLPGLSLNLGLLGDYAGIITKSANSDDLLQDLEMQGMSVFDLPTILSLLERAVLHGTTQRLALGLDFNRYFNAYPHLTCNGMFSKVGSQTGPDHLESHNTLSGHSKYENVEAIADTLRSGLARILGLDSSRISILEKIDQYASDSLTLTQVRGVIMREFHTTFPLMRLFQGPSLQQIAEELQDSLDKGIENTRVSSKTVVDSQSDALMVDGLSVLSRGLIRGTGSGRPVICFHAMGGAASQFNSFLLNPPEGMDPIAVQLAGRENRTEESMPTSLSEIVSEVITELEQSVGTADVFWGHSLGGIIAFEAIRELRRRGKPLPRLLITSTIAPQLAQWLQKREVTLQVSAENVSPEYMMAVSRYVDDIEFARSVLPMMRKDSSLLLQYKYEEEDRLEVPIAAIAARQDDVVYRDEVAGWGAHSEQFKFIEMEGNHWSVVQNNQDLIWETIKNLML
ncbi:Mycocerosic acid synthase [Paramyrothecium foliicola]|nr:Mycocerosic acid synthase [Paramyrothecium foliicola]